jgi:hypothetical protein
MRRPFVAMATLAALAVVLHPPPRVSAATINVNIGSVTWFLGNGTVTGNTNGRGHGARFNNPWRCAFTNNGSLLIADRINNKIRRVVQPRDDLVENWMGNGANADVNGVGTAASFTIPQDIAVMADNTFAFVVEGQAISQINVAASRKYRFGLCVWYRRRQWHRRSLQLPTLHHHLPRDDHAVRWRDSTNSSSHAGWWRERAEWRHV